MTLTTSSHEPTTGRRPGQGSARRTAPLFAQDNPWTVASLTCLGPLRPTVTNLDRSFTGWDESPHPFSRKSREGQRKVPVEYQMEIHLSISATFNRVRSVLVPTW